MHFTTGVILPARITKKSGQRLIKSAVEKLLFRFSPEFKVKRHIAVCDCIEESLSFYTKRDPRYGKPEVNCVDCNGSGRVRTTENDKICFDWWVIGGQWDGNLTKTKRPSSYLWRNCVEVRELPDDYSFFAIVTPNREWHDEDQFIGAKVSAKKEFASWNEYQKMLLKKYRKNLVVLVDCHG